MPGKKFTVSTHENNVGCETVTEVWSLLSEDVVSHVLDLLPPSSRISEQGNRLSLPFPVREMDQYHPDRFRRKAEMKRRLT